MKCKFNLEIQFIKNSLDYIKLNNLYRFLDRIDEKYIIINNDNIIKSDLENTIKENINKYINANIHNTGLFMENKSKGVFVYNIGSNSYNKLFISRLNIKHYSSVINYINENLLDSNIILLLICFDEYYFKSVTYNISNYVVQGIDYSMLPKIYDDKLKMEIIDISKNVGKKHHFDEFDFYTTYKMWFGPVVIAKFGRERILSFQDAEYVRELRNGMIEMQLCDHIDRCDSPENIRRQKALLNHLGIEHYSEAELKPSTGGLTGFLDRWFR